MPLPRFAHGQDFSFDPLTDLTRASVRGS